MTVAVYLDSTPLNLLCHPLGVPRADDCRAWLKALLYAGVEVAIPAVVDYEVRRELTRRGALTRLASLDDLRDQLTYLDVTAAAFDRAAELWALVRNAGLPTADPQALDVDCILAAQATTAEGPGNPATVATANVGHLARFPGIDARDWFTIAP